MKEILDFLAQLSCNNNREWFNEHKESYRKCQYTFEHFTTQWLKRLVEIDPELAGYSPKIAFGESTAMCAFPTTSAHSKNGLAFFRPSKEEKRAIAVDIMYIFNLENVCLQAVCGVLTKTY